jgi:hypothetical protein
MQNGFWSADRWNKGPFLRIGSHPRTLLASDKIPYVNELGPSLRFRCDFTAGWSKESSGTDNNRAATDALAPENYEHV